MTHRLHRLNIRIGFTPSTSIGAGPRGPMVGVHSFKNSPGTMTRQMLTCTHNLRDNNVLSIDGRFPKRKSASMSSRGTLPAICCGHTQLSDVRLLPFHRIVHTKLKNVVIKRLHMPRLRPSELATTSLSQDIIASILGERLNFHKLIFASTLTVGTMSNRHSIATGTLQTNGSVILINESVRRTLRAIVTTVSQKSLDISRIRTGYHGVLACGCLLKLSRRGEVSTSKLGKHVRAIRMRTLTDGLHFTKIAMLHGGFDAVPLPTSRSATVLYMNERGSSRPFVSHFIRCASPIRYFQVAGSVARRR